MYIKASKYSPLTQCLRPILCFSLICVISSCNEINSKIGDPAKAEEKAEVNSLQGFISIPFGVGRDSVEAVMSLRPNVKKKTGWWEDNSAAKDDDSPTRRATTHLRYHGGQFAGLKVSEWIFKFLDNRFASGWVSLEVPSHITEEKYMVSIQKTLSEKYGKHKLVPTRFGSKLVWRLRGGKIDFWVSGSSAPAISYNSFLQENYLDSLQNRAHDEMTKNMQANVKEL